MDDPRAQVDTVYTSYAGITTARITGFTSSLSSCLVLFLILRSANGLSTSYHRLVFGMSVADALGSIAIFCSTWLMPKDMIYSQFQSSVYGHLKPHSACRPLFRQKNQVFNSLSIIKIFSKKEIKHSIFSIALLLIF
mgnify:CR=1 FL=1